MADKPKNPATSAAPAGAAQAAPAKAAAAEAAVIVAPPGPVTWRSVWQLPALVAAVLLLGGGIVAAYVTRPKADAEPLFKQAAALIEKEEYQPALDLLNGKVLAFYDAAALNAEQMRRFHVMRARSVYLGQQQAKVDREDNAQRVVDEYGDAIKAGQALEPRDIYFLADAHVSLGRYERALDLAGGIPASDKALRGKVLKRVVERQLATPGGDKDAMLKLLAEFLKDPELKVADRAWALARQAELLLKHGLNEAAIAKLLQTMPAVVGEAGPEQAGELYLLLGRAYFETGSIPDAGRQLEQAMKLLSETDPRRAEAMVLLGRVEELTHQPAEEARAEAKQKYQTVVEKFPGSPATLPALIGLGEVNAGLNDFESSLKAYGDLVKAMNGGLKHQDATASRATASLLDRVAVRTEAGDLELALRFGLLAEQLYAPDAVPPEVLIAIARTHRSIAEAMLSGTPAGQDGRAVKTPEAGGNRAQSLVRLDPATREQVRLHLISAGRYFRRHAERVGIEDNAGFGASMWLAADSFDLGGDLEQAVPLFEDYVKFFPGDPKQPEARFRLGQACQARGDYGMAAQYYRGLIADAGKAGASVGPYGDASYVPLARTLLMDSDPNDDSEAEELLGKVVKGLVGGPTTPQFRDGLVELGRLRHKRGDYAGAAESLGEAVARFSDDARIDEMRFLLADALRLDAQAIGRTLQEEMPAQRRQALAAARVERLTKAQDLFEQVRRSLEGRDVRQLTALEQLRLRNSAFYLGDCAFDLKDYDAAIRHYDAAREKYPKDPASLVAMIQIVNVYLEQGDTKRAATAHDRAKRFYDSLPPTVWADPNLPIGRNDWQRWLDSIGKLKPVSTAPEKAAEGTER